MNFNFRSATFLVLIIAFNLTAHAASIIGKVIDQKTKEPMEFVNVTIRKVGSDKSMPIGVATNEKGDFNLSNVPVGKYIVKMTYVGYLASLKNVNITSGNGQVSLSSILLSEDGKMLDEVEVVGMKSQMRFDLDKKVFNVDQNIVAAGASASEILETIPSVEVDNDGEVSLRGNTSVTIWINGKPSGLTADNRSQILEQLPAESIEKIEIITNPSARFSPEGTAGIINVVLKQNRAGGYYGSVQGGANTQGGANVNASINYNNTRWDTYASLGFRNRRNESNNDSYRNYDNETFLNSKKRGENTGQNFFFRAGATYNITPIDNITLGGFGMIGKSKNTAFTDYLSDAVNSFTNRKNDNVTNSKPRSGNVELSYRHTFGESHTFDASASFSTWNVSRISKYLSETEFAETNIIKDYQEQDSRVSHNNWEFQLDYVMPISEKFKLEAGYKGALNFQNSPLTTYIGETEAEKELIADLYNDFRYNLNSQALYTSFGGKIDKFNFQGGLRGEYWNVETKSVGYQQNEKEVNPYVKDNFAIFPSAFVSYSLPQENELQINYTRRIQRPWGGQLNSFVNISDPTNISYGNPFLNPQYSHSMELNYIKTWEQHMVSLQGYYRSTDNVIQRISFMAGDVMNTTYENISQSTSTGTELVIKNRFFKILDITSTFNLFYYAIDGFSYIPKDGIPPVIGKKSDNVNWNIRAMASVRLPWGMSVQLNGGYSAKQIYAQGYRKPQYHLDAGVRKSFDKWNVSLSVRDILNSRQWHSYTYGQNFNQESKSWRGGTTARLTVSYSFGNMKEKKKRNNYDDSESQQSAPIDDIGAGMGN